MVLTPNRTLRPCFIDPSCVLSLRMMEGVGNFLEDSSGYENHGTNNGATWTSPGHFPTVTGDQCLYFDGNDYVDCGTGNGLDFGTGDFTVSAWFKTSNDTFQAIFGKQDTVAVTGWYVYINSVSNAVDLYHRVSGTAKAGSINIIDGKWHHAVFTRDGAVGKLYIDGIEDIGIASGDLSADVNSVGDSAIIGKRDLANDRYFWGTIDEVRIYNRVLTSDEVLAHYNGGRLKPSR